MFVKASTKENQTIINKIIQNNLNDFKSSKYLRKGIGNPIYAMLKDEAKRQDLGLRILRNSLVEILDENEVVATFSPNTPNLSFPTRKLLNNKKVTKNILSINDIPVPRGEVFVNYELACKYFLQQKKPQVIKPLTGSGGKGVTANIDINVNLEVFEHAWKKAKEISSKVIVEDFVHGDEVRVFVLDGKVEAAICRLPAYVIGNGEKTIEELVEEKNLKRKENPLLKIYPIKSFDYLYNNLKLNLEFIPYKNQYIRLSSTSNIAQGGESVSILEILHPSIKTMCEKAWQSVPGATQIGLDVILTDFSAPVNEKNFCIIEINADPAVATPAFAYYGKPALDLPAKLINSILSKSNKDDKTIFKKIPEYVDRYNGQYFPSSSYMQVNLIRQAAYKKGYHLIKLDHVTSLIEINDNKYLFWQGIPHSTRIASAQITTNKEWTKNYLKEIDGVKTPEGEVFNIEDDLNILSFFNKLEDKVVLKPIAGSGGFGVITDIDSLEKLVDSLVLLKNMGISKILCERHISGKDYRLMITKNGFYAASNRIPAYIIGDGRSSVSELLKRKNILRKKNPFLGYKDLKITNIIKEKLSYKGVDQSTILDGQQYLQLDTVANIGTGGESLDVTDNVHSDWLPICESIRKKIYEATHIGIDIIAEDISISPEKQAWVVLEVNSNPDYGLHHFPMYGCGRDAAGAVLDSIVDNQLVNSEIIRRVLIIKDDENKVKETILTQCSLMGVNCSFIEIGGYMYEVYLDGNAKTLDALEKILKRLLKI